MHHPSLKEKFIVNEKGRKTAVILPFHEYQQMLEDMHDLAIVAERRDEPSIPFDELKKRLAKDGLI